MFGIILESALVTRAAFSPTMFRCSLYLNLASIWTPRYLRDGFYVISQSPTLMVIVSVIFLLVVSTTSVLWSASYSPTDESHRRIITMALFAIHVTSSRYSSTTITATLSAKLTVLAPLGSCNLNSASYNMFHRPGPRIEPCGTPPVIW